MRMRIGIDARLNGYREGGIAEYTRNLLKALADLDAFNDYRVLTAARPKVDAQNIIPGPNFRRDAVFTPPHHRFERSVLSVEVARLGLDVLHSPDFIPPRFGARHSVITVHDLNFLYYPQFQTADSLRYYAGNIRSAVQKADHILAVSQSAADDLGNMLGVAADKITIQPEGVGPEFQRLPVEEVRAVQNRFGLAPSYLLFVGTFEPRKNLLGLLDAYRILIESLPDAPPLVLAGRRGWLYESIFQKVEELNLAKRVHWLENVASAELPAVYNGAVALVLPSFYEGFGLTALEAMACGIPTIVSNRGSLPEVVADTGLLVDPDRADELADAMRCMLTDSDLRQRSAKAGLQRAAGFTWQRTAEIALSVYRKVLGC